MSPRKPRQPPTDLCVSCGSATGTRHIKGTGWICYSCDEGADQGDMPDVRDLDDLPDGVLLEAFSEARAERRAKEQSE